MSERKKAEGATAKTKPAIEDTPSIELTSPPTNPFRAHPFYPQGFPDPQRPVLSALIEAEAQKTDYLFCELFTADRAKKIKSLEDKLTWIDEFTKATKEWLELMSWAYQPSPPMSEATAMDWVQWMRAQGFPEMFWKSFYKRAGKQNKGRPISKRQIAVAVLEKKMTEPGRAWRELPKNSVIARSNNMISAAKKICGRALMIYKSF